MASAPDILVERSDSAMAFNGKCSNIGPIRVSMLRGAGTILISCVLTDVEGHSMGN